MSRGDMWMPLYVGDYMADTMHLTTTEHGAYLLLIMHYWRAGPLPRDDKILQGIARVSRQAWSQGIGETIKAFFYLKEGHWHHKRIDEEIERCQGVINQRKAAGRASAQARWRQREGNARSTDVEQPLNGGCNLVEFPLQRDDTPSPSPISKKDSVLRTDAPPVGDARDLLWSDGLPFLRSITGLTEGRARALLGRFVKDATGDCARVRAILAQAARDRPIDPVPWITEALKARTKRESSMDRISRDWSLPGIADLDANAAAISETEIPKDAIL